MKSAILLFLLALNASALTTDQIKGLLKKEHDRKNVIKQLLIFPEAREFELQTTVSTPKNLGLQPKLISKEKTVEGKYIVTETLLGTGENEMKIINVTTYLPKQESYKMWAYHEKFNLIEEYDGIHLAGSKTITWYKTGETEKGHQHSVTVCLYTKDTVKWKELRFDKGKLVFQINGVATKTK